MKILYKALMLFFPVLALASGDLDDSSFFNTKVLKDVSKLKSELLHQNFKEVSLTTFDSKKLVAYIREVKNPRFTFIAFNGLNLNLMGGHSDLSEMSFLASMLPVDCTILLVNKRGIDGSAGSQWMHINQNNALNLMMHDVKSALEYAHNLDQGPKFLFGVCYGAFCITRTYLSLSESDKQRLNIVGLVFDSGWTSLTRMVEDGIDARFNHLTRNSYLNNKLTSATKFLYSTFLKNQVTQTDDRFSIQDDIKNLDIPMLIVHSVDDPLAKVEMIIDILGKVPQCTYHIFPPGTSTHGIHFLKQKHIYNKLLNNFCYSIVKQKATYFNNFAVFSALPVRKLTTLGAPSA